MEGPRQERVRKVPGVGCSKEAGIVEKVNGRREERVGVVGGWIREGLENDHKI